MDFSEACGVVGPHAAQPALARAHAAMDQGANAWQGDMQKQSHHRMDDCLQLAALESSMEPPASIHSMLPAFSAGSCPCTWACKAQCSWQYGAILWSSHAD